MIKYTEQKLYKEVYNRLPFPVPLLKIICDYSYEISFTPSVLFELGTFTSFDRCYVMNNYLVAVEEIYSPDMVSSMIYYKFQVVNIYNKKKIYESTFFLTKYLDYGIRYTSCSDKYICVYFFGNQSNNNVQIYRYLFSINNGNDTIEYLHTTIPDKASETLVDNKNDMMRQNTLFFKHWMFKSPLGKIFAIKDNIIYIICHFKDGMLRCDKIDILTCKMISTKEVKLDKHNFNFMSYILFDNTICISYHNNDLIRDNIRVYDLKTFKLITIINCNQLVENILDYDSSQFLLMSSNILYIIFKNKKKNDSVVIKYNIKKKKVIMKCYINNTVITNWYVSENRLWCMIDNILYECDWIVV